MLLEPQVGFSLWYSRYSEIPAVALMVTLSQHSVCSHGDLGLSWLLCLQWEAQDSPRMCGQEISSHLPDGWACRPMGRQEGDQPLTLP